MSATQESSKPASVPFGAFQLHVCRLCGWRSQTREGASAHRSKAHKVVRA